MTIPYQSLQYYFEHSSFGCSENLTDKRRECSRFGSALTPINIYTSLMLFRIISFTLSSGNNKKTLENNSQRIMWQVLLERKQASR